MNVLIAFYSRNGAVEALAKAMADGARGQGAQVRLRRVREVVSPEVIQAVPTWAANAERMNAAYPAPTLEDAEWADGIALGAPTRFAAVGAELRAWLDGLGPLWAKGSLNLKAGAAFTSTGTPHGGNETTILSLYPTMAHLGLVIVPNGYGDPVLYNHGTPYGASSVSYSARLEKPTEEDLHVARYQGARLATVAGALKAGRKADARP